MIRGGRLTELLRMFEPAAPSVDAHGQVAETWTDRGYVYAELLSTRGDEGGTSSGSSAHPQRPDIVAVFRVRLRTLDALGISRRWRFVWRGDEWDIVDAAPEGADPQNQAARITAAVRGGSRT